MVESSKAEKAARAGWEAKQKLIKAKAAAKIKPKTKPVTKGYKK